MNDLQKWRDIIRESLDEPRWFAAGKPIDDISAVSDDIDGILEPEEYEWEWRRCRVPLLAIYSDNAPYSDPERLDSVRSAAKLPPVILALRPDGRAELLDGGHRIELAKERKATEIDAVVGRPL